MSQPATCVIGKKKKKKANRRRKKEEQRRKWRKRMEALVSVSSLNWHNWQKKGFGKKGEELSSQKEKEGRRKMKGTKGEMTRSSLKQKGGLVGKVFFSKP